MSGSSLIEASYSPSSGNASGGGTVLGGNIGSGRSASFDGISQYFKFNNTYNTNNSTGIGADSNDFTLEWFMKYSSTQNSTYPTLFSELKSDGTVAGGGFSIDIYNDTVYYQNGAGTTPTFGLAGKTYKDHWVHIALARKSNSMKAYFNGVQIGTAVSDNNNIHTDYPFMVGCQSKNGVAQVNNTCYTGLLTNVRWTNVCVYNGPFTVPTGPLSATQSANPFGGANTAAISGTDCRLLMLCTSGVAYDSSSFHNGGTAPAGHAAVPSSDGPF